MGECSHRACRCEGGLQLFIWNIDFVVLVVVVVVEDTPPMNDF